MAKKYRTERDILTIELQLKIPPDELKKGVSTDISNVLKISAYPAVWRWLRETLHYGDRRDIDDILEDAIRKAKVPPLRTKIKDIDKDDHCRAFKHFADISDRIDADKHYRGKLKAKSHITTEIKDIARWLHWFFRFWKEEHPRPDEIQAIYDGRLTRIGKGTKDPTSMTYFCCQVLHEEGLKELGESFPNKDSFRTSYLKGGSINRRTKVEEITQLIEKKGHPLNIVRKICRKLQE